MKMAPETLPEVDAETPIDLMIRVAEVAEFCIPSCPRPPTTPKIEDGEQLRKVRVQEALLFFRTVRRWTRSVGLVARVISSS